MSPPPLTQRHVAIPEEPPLWAPYYGAPAGVAISRCWKKYATFSGRASRSEFWWWCLAFSVFVAAFGVVLGGDRTGTAVVGLNVSGLSLGRADFMVSAILSLIFFTIILPTLAITWRRLHDTNRGGQYFLFGLVPLVGTVVLIVYLASETNPAGVRFDLPAV